MSGLFPQLNSEMSTVVQAAGRSLVKVGRPQNGAGAGTVIQADGLILTNAHVVGHGRPQVTLADGHSLPAKVLALDADLDLALLSIEALSGDALASEGHHLFPLELGDSTLLRPGALVFSLGHPWGVPGAVSAGMVIHVGPPPELPTKQDFIQSDVHLRPGHSGGPMVNAQGQLVGINTLITGPAVGLAVPAQTIKEFLRASIPA